MSASLVTLSLATFGSLSQFFAARTILAPNLALAIESINDRRRNNT